MSMFDRALEIASRAHTGQTDRAGQPYILHPLRVMFGCRTDEQKLVALLHDVIEDSDVTVDDLLREGFSEDIVTAVDLLSRRLDESYEEFIDRLSGNTLAVQVKLKDLEDNMNLQRLQHWDGGTEERIRRYHAAWLRLMLQGSEVGSGSVSGKM